MNEQLLTFTESNSEWFEFDGVAYPASKLGPRVTLNPAGILRLGMRSLEALNEPKAVKLFFDARHSRMGIKPSSPDDPRAFPVRHQANHKHGYVHAKRFCKRFNITFDGTVEFLNAKVDKDGMMILEFSNARLLG